MPFTHVALVGLMGSGKSAVGEIVGARLGLPLVDVDDEITRRTGRSVRDLWEEGGEAAYRPLEQAIVLEALAPGPGKVLAAPGGVVVDPTAEEALAQAHVAVVVPPCGPGDARRARPRGRPAPAPADARPARAPARHARPTGPPIPGVGPADRGRRGAIAPTARGCGHRRVRGRPRLAPSYPHPSRKVGDDVTPTGSPAAEGAAPEPGPERVPASDQGPVVAAGWDRAAARRRPSATDGLLELRPCSSWNGP